MADAKQDISNGSSSQTRVVLAKPRLGGFGSSTFGASSSSKNNNPFGSVLRPPQLKPSSNPFVKVTDTTGSSGSNTEKGSESVSEERLQDMKETEEAPKFVPLASNVTPRSTNPVPAPTQPATSSSGFVFGQNLSDRVVIKENVNNGEASSVDHSATNGTTELLFTNAAASVKENNQDDAGPSETSGNSSGDGLAAAAAEYERSHARPPPPTTNYNITGEEDEINILQISCRLFAWEAGSWRERGRGVLRLNDAAGGAARLVARVSGSLRVVLNTKLWPGMVVERAAANSLRITAADAQQLIKLFLIMGAQADISQLHRALMTRVASSKQTMSCKQNTASERAAERLEADISENDYVDRPSDDSRSGDRQKIESDLDNESKSDRLAESPQKTDGDIESHVDNEMNEDKSKTLKRKEPAEDETSPKRQCPDILIE